MDTEQELATRLAMAWIERMAYRYGPVVTDRNGVRYDWGQALAREVYGPGWMQMDLVAPGADDMDTAWAWERGEWPDWAVLPDDSQRRVLVCGDRTWGSPTDEGFHDHFRVVVGTLDALHAQAPIEMIIEGCCRGVDRIAGQHQPGDVPGTDDPGWAWLNRVPGYHFPADWTLGRRAGPLRNSRMLMEGRPSEVIAFHDDLRSSRGTRDMVKKARAAGVPVRLYNGLGHEVLVPEDLP